MPPAEGLFYTLHSVFCISGRGVNVRLILAATFRTFQQLSTRQMLGLRSGVIRVGFDGHLYFSARLQPDLLTILVS
jgi:hypothetical protein